MGANKRVSDYISLGRPFIMLLIGQAIMELGDNFRILAVTTLLLNLTGSGLAAGFSLVITPIIGIVLSPLGGALGDGMDERKILSFLYIVEGSLTLLFMAGIPLEAIYGILTLFAGVQILQEPIFRKILRNSLRDRDIALGNSISSGVSGFINLLGPLVGGIGLKYWGPNRVLIWSSVGYGLASFIILSLGKDLRNGGAKVCRAVDSKVSIKRYIRDIGQGAEYFKSITSLRELGRVAFMLSFGTASVSFTFYSLVFDHLGLSAGEWGFLLSVFYSTRLLAMVLSIVMDKGDGASFSVYPILMIVAIPWLVYGYGESLYVIIPALVIEGTSHFLFEIFFWTKIQLLSEKTFLGRVIGSVNILSNMARILGIIFAYYIIRVHGIKEVFLINAGLLFLYAFYKFLVLGKGKRI